MLHALFAASHCGLKLSSERLITLQHSSDYSFMSPPSQLLVSVSHTRNRDDSQAPSCSTSQQPQALTSMLQFDFRPKALSETATPLFSSKIKENQTSPLARALLTPPPTIAGEKMMSRMPVSQSTRPPGDVCLLYTSPSPRDS